MVRNSKTISLTPNNQLPRPAANFLKIYIDFAYFLCLCPFRLVAGIDGKNVVTHFTVKSSFLQKFLCALTAFLWLFWQMRMIYDALPRKDAHRASTYFGLILKFISLSMKAITLMKFWRDQPGILNIVNFLVKERHCDRVGSFSAKNSIFDNATISKIFALCVCFLYFAVGISNIAAGRGLGSTCSWNAECWWKSMQNQAYLNFFLELGVSDTNGTTNSFSRSTYLDNIVGVAGVLGFFPR